MAIVFVHGVSNRAGPAYEARKALIGRFCETHLAGLLLGESTLETASPLFPYWGGDAADFRWDNASLPTGSFDALGASPVELSFRPIVASLVERLPKDDVQSEPLFKLARQDSVTAVEQLSAILLDPQVPGSAADKAAFIVAAQRFALQGNAQPPAGIVNDQQWVQWLGSAVQTAHGGESLGLFGDISNSLAAGAQLVKNAVVGAGEQLVDRAGNIVSSLLVTWGREPLNTNIGRFVGDIFVYLDKRGSPGQPGPIPKVVLGAIQTARVQHPHEPLVLIGHSLGGVILYDLLTSFVPDIPVAAFVTVGSQVGFFEELKLYRASDPAIGKPNRVKRPPNIQRWINVFDPVDILSYRCSSIFNDVLDFQYDSHTHTLQAHGAYLEQDRFYARLRERLSV
jgi:hypothetical protein